MKAFLIFLANIKPLIQEGKILYDDAVKLYRKNFNKDPEGIEALQLRKEFSKAAEGEKVIPIAPRLPKEAPYSEKNPSGWMPTAEEESGIMSRLKGQIDDLKEQASKYEDMSVSDFMSDYFNMPKSKTPVTDKIQKQLGDVKLFGDETFEELQIIKETGKHPRNKADGGRIGYATGAGVKAYRGIKALMDKVNKRFGKETLKTADDVARPESAINRELFKKMSDKLKGKTPEKAGQGQFTKAEVIIGRLQNTLNDIKPGDEDYEYVSKTFPNWIKEIQAKPQLADNENVFQRLAMEGLPKNQRLKVYDDGTVDFQTLKPTHTFKLKEEIKRKLNANGGLNYLMGL